MKKKQNILFSSYYDDVFYEGWEEDVKKNLLDSGVWEKEDIPKEILVEEMNYWNECEWEDFKYEMEKFMEGKTFVLTGTFGSWIGPQKGGRIIQRYEDIIDSLKMCDYVKFYDENGHLFIKGSHHDGNNYYELRELNDKGIKFLDNNEYSISREQLCETLFTSAYSKLPRYAKKVYGC